MVRDAVFEGRLTGTLNSKGRLEVADGGEVLGHVEVGSLGLKKGGRITGSLVVGSTAPAPIAPSRTERPSAPAGPAKKGKFVRGLEELAKFALGRK